MTTISRLRVPITGAGVVGPSVLTLYSDAGIGAVRTSLQTFLQSIKAGLPPDVTYTIPAAGDDIDDATGNYIGQWTAGTVTTTTGTSVAGYAQGVGVRMILRTAGITANRRVNGTMFIVPVSKDIFTGSGGIDDAVRTPWQTALNTFVTGTAGSLRVWSRPKGVRAGDSHVVTSGFLPDSVSWLRSRRT